MADTDAIRARRQPPLLGPRPGLGAALPLPNLRGPPARLAGPLALGGGGVRAEARLPAAASREEPRAGPRRRGLARGVRLDPAGEEELGGEDEEDESDLVDQGRAAIEDELGADPGAGPIVRLLARQTAVLAAALPR